MEENTRFIPVNKPLIDISKLKDVVYREPVFASGKVLPAGIDALQKKREYEEQREEENRKNLIEINNNSKDIIEKLEKQITQKDEDIQIQREMINLLRQQLTGIQRTLSDIFILEESNNELQSQANETAKEICALIIQGKKIDWKSVALDKGIDVLLTSIPIILQILKVI